MSYESCFRGIGVLAPSEGQGSMDDINKLDNRVYDVTESGLKLCCSTVKNDTTLNPQTSSVVLEVCKGEDAIIKLWVNGIEQKV